ncbi:zinc-binding dehydrogenase [Cupriavidus sp. BIC8F]|uniref:zinc-binding dehydrogenase n=1 Tax=Cupriavidus sp. BIC8F TaxID=3079014 RepID=UPI002916D78F|nr:zinc-binding dehydrogenase [Cupriavidus sp. BIC8F]
MLDLVGGDTQARSWPVLRPGGMLVSTDARPDRERARAAGAQGRHFATRADAEQFTAFAQSYASGELRTQNAAVYPRANAARALARSMGGHVRGKLLIEAA